MSNLLTFTKAIQAPLAHVYYTFSTKSGWLEWFAHKVSGSVHKDQTLQVHLKGGSYVLHFHTIVEKHRVTFTMIDLSTYGLAEVEVDLQEENDQVAVNVKVETNDEVFQAKQKKLWKTNLENLKSVVETGKDLNLWDRPFLGINVEDWVSPELAQEKGLPTESGMLLNSVFEGRGADLAGIQGGDIIFSLDGVEIVDYDTLLDVFSQHNAGDTIPVDFYHGQELKHNVIKLSQYPVPDIPANAQELADRLSQFFVKVNEKIDQLLEGQTEAQLNYRPSGGEWSAIEILAHLTAGFTDTIIWLGSYIVGRPVFSYTSGVPSRIKTLLELYPTIDEMQKAFRLSQKELVTLISQIPAEISGRKSSLARLAYNIIMDHSYHYKDHLSQLKDTLEQAADVSSS